MKLLLDGPFTSNAIEHKLVEIAVLTSCSKRPKLCNKGEQRQLIMKTTEKKEWIKHDNKTEHVKFAWKRLKRLKNMHKQQTLNEHDLIVSIT